jgi:hypothetical protein
MNECAELEAASSFSGAAVPTIRETKYSENGTGMTEPTSTGALNPASREGNLKMLINACQRMLQLYDHHKVILKHSNCGDSEGGPKQASGLIHVTSMYGNCTLYNLIRKSLVRRLRDRD